jgi:hypothetical protein
LSSLIEAPNGDDEGILAPMAEGEHGSAGSELFPNDRGTLNVETRRALVLLLQGPSIDGSRQSKLWKVLLRDEALLRQHLHNLFLDLVVDYDQSVAFTRQVVAESIDAPVLLRRNSLTFLESALVLLLRQRLTQADAQGERAVLSKSEMFEHLQVYERDRNVDHARFERQMDNAIEKAKKLNLLHKTRGSEERYEVSPTLKLLFPAEDIEALARTYRALVTAAEAKQGQDPPGEPDDAPSTAAADDSQEED